MPTLDIDRVARSICEQIDLQAKDTLSEEVKSAMGGLPMGPLDFWVVERVIPSEPEWTPPAEYDETALKYSIIDARYYLQAGASMGNVAAAAGVDPTAYESLKRGLDDSDVTPELLAQWAQYVLRENQGAKYEVLLRCDDFHLLANKLTQMRNRSKKLSAEIIGTVLSQLPTQVVIPINDDTSEKAAALDVVHTVLLIGTSMLAYMATLWRITSLRNPIDFHDK